MPRQDRVDQLRDNGVLVADYTGKELLAALQFFYEIATQLIFDRVGLILGRPEFAKGSWVIHMVCERFYKKHKDEGSYGQDLQDFPRFTCKS